MRRSHWLFCLHNLVASDDMEEIVTPIYKASGSVLSEAQKRKR